MLPPERRLNPCLAPLTRVRSSVKISRRGLLFGFALGALARLTAAEGARLFFSRNFPGSVPEYFEASVDAAGGVSYREGSDEDPLDHLASEETVRRLFETAEKLDRFRRPLASSLKTAFTGDKILRYVSETGETSEAAFVYSEVDEAQELVSWFLKLAETERHLIELERVLRFDRLGVNTALGSLERSYNRDRVVSPEHLLPILRKINAEKKIIHLARSRAAALIERIEAAAKGERAR